jgi:hypothetical protein
MDVWQLVMALQLLSIIHLNLYTHYWRRQFPYKHATPK